MELQNGGGIGWRKERGRNQGRDRGIKQRGGVKKGRTDDKRISLN